MFKSEIHNNSSVRYNNLTFHLHFLNERKRFRVNNFLTKSVSPKISKIVLIFIFEVN